MSSEPGRGRVKVELVPFASECGYEIRVAHPQATVGDYLRALETLVGEPALTRRRNPGGTCYACPRCCAERIPITSIDLMRLAGVQEVTGGVPDPGRRPRLSADGPRADDRRGATVRPHPLLSAVKEYGWVSVWGRVVDITLRRGEAGECVFLDLGSGLCRQYHRRPLVCRTYFCSPCGPLARKVREAVVNRGQDELVRLLLEHAGPYGFPINEADDADLRLEDWQEPNNPYRGKTDYDEVLLREVLSQKLWKRVYVPGL